MVDTKEIKNLIKEYKFEKCANILRKDIIEKIISDIKKVKSDYEYTDIYDLNIACSLYLDSEKKNITKQMLSFKDIDIADEIEILLYAYKIAYEK